MTTTITPSSGAGALFTQQGVGSTPGYSALDDRRSNSGSLQEGVFGTSTLVTAGGVSNVAAADFMVTQRAAGANMSVDVNMPAGGFAFVQGDTINGQGLYTVPVHSANINEAIAAADATFPRVDQIILEIQDNVLDASGGNLARTRVLTGTPTGGATLGNRSGAAALPGSALLLADVLVGNGVASVGNTVMRDRRKWARGASLSILNTGTNYPIASSALTAMSGISGRLECGGLPVTVTLSCVGNNGTAGDGVVSGLSIDSATAFQGNVYTSVAAGALGGLGFVYEFTPAAGSHTFQAMVANAVGGTATLFGTTSDPMTFSVRERVNQNTGNNTVTTG